MSDIKNIDDFRSDEYWSEAIKPDEREIVSFADLEQSSDDRVAYIKFFNLIHELHEKGMSMDDIFCGGLRALMYKSIDICGKDQIPNFYKRAHDEITKYNDTPCYERLGIDDIT